MPPDRSPAELDTLRTALLSATRAWEEYDRLTLRRSAAIRDGEVAQIRLLGRAATAAYRTAEDLSQEALQARWKAIDAGHAPAELDSLAARWKGTATHHLEDL